jgi:SAM-dependent methyltransferase
MLGFGFIKLPSTVDYVRKFVQEIAESIPPGKTVIDAGAGECQYKTLFAHTHYIAVDLCVGDSTWDWSQVDVKAALHDIPLPDNIADVILCTEVLEHVSNPAEVVRELARLLKPGGQLFITVPFSAREHQTPFDYFRFTQFGVRYLCEQAGLLVDFVKPIRGDFYRLYCVAGEQGAHIKGSIYQLPILLLKLYLATFMRKLESLEKDVHGSPAWHCKATKPNSALRPFHATPPELERNVLQNNLRDEA